MFICKTKPSFCSLDFKIIQEEGWFQQESKGCPKYTITHVLNNHTAGFAFGSITDRAEEKESPELIDLQIVDDLVKC